MEIISRGPLPVDGLIFTISGNVTVSVTYDFKAAIITKSLLPANIVNLFFDDVAPPGGTITQRPTAVVDELTSSLESLTTIEKRVIHITGSFLFTNTSANIISASVFMDAAMLLWNNNKIVVYNSYEPYIGYTNSVENGVKQIPGTTNIS